MYGHFSKFTTFVRNYGSPIGGLGTALGVGIGTYTYRNDLEISKVRRKEKEGRELAIELEKAKTDIQKYRLLISDKIQRKKALDTNEVVDLERVLGYPLRRLSTIRNEILPEKFKNEYEILLSKFRVSSKNMNELSSNKYSSEKDKKEAMENILTVSMDIYNTINISSIAAVNASTEEGNELTKQQKIVKDGLENDKSIYEIRVQVAESLKDVLEKGSVSLEKEKGKDPTSSKYYYWQLFDSSTNSNSDSKDKKK